MVLLLCYLGSPYDHRQESGVPARARQRSQLRQPSTQTHRLQPPAVLRSKLQSSDLCNQWLAQQISWLQRGCDCTLTRLTHWSLEDVQGQVDQTGKGDARSAFYSSLNSSDLDANGTVHESSVNKTPIRPVSGDN